MVITNDIALVKDGAVINVSRLHENSPEQAYELLVYSHGADYHVVVTEETGKPEIGGEWDGQYFYPILDKEYMELNKIMYDPKTQTTSISVPCPKPGEMLWDPKALTWVDIPK